jgi:hypothetical protein
MAVVVVLARAPGAARQSEARRRCAGRLAEGMGIAGARAWQALPCGLSRRDGLSRRQGRVR